MPFKCAEGGLGEEGGTVRRSSWFFLRQLSVCMFVSAHVRDCVARPIDGSPIYGIINTAAVLGWGEGGRREPREIRWAGNPALSPQCHEFCMRVRVCLCTCACVCACVSLLEAFPLASFLLLRAPRFQADQLTMVGG